MNGPTRDTTSDIGSSRVHCSTCPSGKEDRKPGEEPNAWGRAFSHIEIAPILTIGSGGPVNVVTGGDDNRTGAFPFTSRPLGISRNAARLPSTATLDLRVLKYLNLKPHGKLDLVVEAFKLVTSHESERPYPVAITAVPGGMAIMYVHRSK